MIDYGFGVRLGTLGLADDGGVLFRWRNSPEIMRWTRQNDLLTWERHVAWFQGHQTDPTIKMYGTFTESHEIVGVCGLTSIDLTNRRAEFSLYIGPEHQGKGHGRAALQTLVHHGFMALNLNCVWGETFDGNPAARLFESLGFVKEGSRRDFYYRDGKYLDAHLYSLLRRDWDRLVLDRITEGRTSSSTFSWIKEHVSARCPVGYYSSEGGGGEAQAPGPG